MLEVNVEDYKVDKNKVEDELLEEVCYGIRMGEVSSKIKVEGKEKDNGACFCKMLIYRKAKPSFYIKVDVQEDFVDPWGQGMSEGQLIAHQNRTGKSSYKYVRVSEEVFQSYLRFLDTRNNMHYRKAQREYEDRVVY